MTSTHKSMLGITILVIGTIAAAAWYTRSPDCAELLAKLEARIKQPAMEAQDGCVVYRGVCGSLEDAEYAKKNPVQRGNFSNDSGMGERHAYNLYGEDWVACQKAVWICKKDTEGRCHTDLEEREQCEKCLQERKNTTT